MSGKLVLAFSVLIAICVGANAIVYSQLRTIQAAARGAVVSAAESTSIGDAYRAIIEQQNAVRAHGIMLGPEFLVTEA